MPKEERKCASCQEIEDEKHVLLYCPAYNECRKKVTDWIAQTTADGASRDLWDFIVDSILMRNCDADNSPIFVVSNFAHAVVKRAFLAYRERLMLV